MKIKISSLLLVAFLLAATILAGCGSSGSGGTSVPGGVNAGIASKVSLLPVQNVAQTNTFITLRARVLDGNGNALPDVAVNFTNMSLTGVLSAVTAVTNKFGNAEVNISSTTSGFATILAQVSTAAGQARDQKTVFFTSLGLNLVPFLVLDVDGNGNGIYNEPSDFILFEPGVPNDNQVIIRATVFDGLGLPASGEKVTFGSDSPASEVTFPLGNTAITDSNGQAFVLVQVTPSILSNFTTVINITALASNGAFNMVSLFLEPVTVSTITLSANPTSVDSGGTSDIAAVVTTSAGTPVADGTTVAFTASAGSLDTPFAQTTAGVAKATLTAPTVTSATSVTVTAKVGGKTGSVSVAVTVPVAPVCTASAPTVTVAPSATLTISAAAPVAKTYTLTVKNNDTAACASATFTLTKTSDTLNPLANISFTVPSTFTVTAPPCTLVPGGTCTATVIHSPTATLTSGDTLATLVTVTAAGHTNATSTVTTTIGP